MTYALLLSLMVLSAVLGFCCGWLFHRARENATLLYGRGDRDWFVRLLRRR